MGKERGDNRKKKEIYKELGGKSEMKASSRM